MKIKNWQSLHEPWAPCKWMAASLMPCIRIACNVWRDLYIYSLVVSLLSAIYNDRTINEKFNFSFLRHLTGESEGWEDSVPLPYWIVFFRIITCERKSNHLQVNKRQRKSLLKTCPKQIGREEDEEGKEEEWGFDAISHENRNLISQSVQNSQNGFDMMSMEYRSRANRIIRNNNMKMCNNNKMKLNSFHCRTLHCMWFGCNIIFNVSTNEVNEYLLDYDFLPLVKYPSFQYGTKSKWKC